MIPHTPPEVSCANVARRTKVKRNTRDYWATNMMIRSTLCVKENIAFIHTNVMPRIFQRLRDSPNLRFLHARFEFCTTFEERIISPYLKFLPPLPGVRYQAQAHERFPNRELTAQGEPNPVIALKREKLLPYEILRVWNECPVIYRTEKCDYENDDNINRNDLAAFKSIKMVIIS